MYLHFIPALLQWFFPALLWHMPRTDKIIYLTFDDGPIPEVTPAVLGILREWQAQATFFCVGENIQKHPDVLQQIMLGGHQLGNHTFHHLNGFKTPLNEYLKNTALCQQQLPASAGVSKKLFRPPYGRIRACQRKALQEDYRIVMWDVLSADFDAKLSPGQCLAKSIRYTKPGSIVVFHDSLKAWDRLSWVLPRYLEHFSKLGYSFKSL